MLDFKRDTIIEIYIIFITENRPLLPYSYIVAEVWNNKNKFVKPKNQKFWIITRRSSFIVDTYDRPLARLTVISASVRRKTSCTYLLRLRTIYAVLLAELYNRIAVTIAVITTCYAEYVAVSVLMTYFSAALRSIRNIFWKIEISNPHRCRNILSDRPLGHRDAYNTLHISVYCSYTSISCFSVVSRVFRFTAFTHVLVATCVRQLRSRHRSTPVHIVQYYILRLRAFVSFARPLRLVYAIYHYRTYV